MEEEARQSAAVLPSPAVLDKIMRYETMLKKDLHRDMIQFRNGCNVGVRASKRLPPPLLMEVSSRELKTAFLPNGPK